MENLPKYSKEKTVESIDTSRIYKSTIDYLMDLKDNHIDKGDFSIIQNSEFFKDFPKSELPKIIEILNIVLAEIIIGYNINSGFVTGESYNAPITVDKISNIFTKNKPEIVEKVILFVKRIIDEQERDIK